MGRCILKVNPEEDLYVIWTSITDYWVFAGTREDIAEYWRDEYGRQGMEDFDRIMARADEWGSSAMRQFGDWDDEFLGVQGHGQLRRSDLWAFIEAEGDDEAQAKLLISRDDRD